MPPNANPKPNNKPPVNTIRCLTFMEPLPMFE
jgi:hypothetical protein